MSTTGVSFDREVRAKLRTIVGRPQAEPKVRSTRLMRINGHVWARMPNEGFTVRLPDRMVPDALVGDAPAKVAESVEKAAAEAKGPVLPVVRVERPMICGGAVDAGLLAAAEVNGNCTTDVLIQCWMSCCETAKSGRPSSLASMAITSFSVKLASTRTTTGFCCMRPRRGWSGGVLGHVTP